MCEHKDEWCEEEKRGCQGCGHWNECKNEQSERLAEIEFAIGTLYYEGYIVYNQFKNLLNKYSKEVKKFLETDESEE